VLEVEPFVSLVDSGGENAEVDDTSEDSGELMLELLSLGETSMSEELGDLRGVVGAVEIGDERLVTSSLGS